MKVLERAWINCLRMWDWISANLPNGFRESSTGMKEFVVGSLKRQWLRENKFTKLITSNCFFCAYDKKHGHRCESCPAALVQKNFLCTDDTHHFAHDPIGFYQYLVKLNSKRGLK